MAKPWVHDFWFSRSDMWRSLPSDSPRISAELVACSITNRRLCLQKILELIIKLCGDAPLEFFLAKNSNKHETNRGHATPSTQLAKVQGNTTSLCNMKHKRLWKMWISHPVPQSLTICTSFAWHTFAEGKWNAKHLAAREQTSSF